MRSGLRVQGVPALDNGYAKFPVTRRPFRMLCDGRC